MSSLGLTTQDCPVYHPQYTVRTVGYCTQPNWLSIVNLGFSWRLYEIGWHCNCDGAGGWPLYKMNPVCSVSVSYSFPRLHALDTIALCRLLISK